MNSTIELIREDYMHKSVAALIALCCAILLTASCGKKAPDEKKPDSDAVTEQAQSKADAIQEWGERKIFRGFANFGDEIQLFQPCGSSASYWVTDNSGQFWDLHYDIAPRTDSFTQVFAIVEASLGPPTEDGPGSNYPGTLLIEEILYMTHEGMGCKTYWNKFQFHASGNEPSWSADVTDAGLLLKRMGEPDRTWTDITRTNFENGVRYVGGDANDTVEFVLTRIPCRDTMSGTYFGYNAVLKLRSGMLRGCAVPGIDSAPLQAE